jgi:hypothetical protein
MVKLLRSVLVVLALGFGVGAGVMVIQRVAPTLRPLPDPAAVVQQIREVAELETLRVSLYKKVSFAPEPTAADSFWGDVAGWLRHTFDAPRGKAIVFADARLGLDLSKLDAQAVRVDDRRVHVTLPPVKVEVVLRPGDTEIIGSNLDSAQTAQLLELARVAFEREVSADRHLRERARASAERAVGGLLLSLGFQDVRFDQGSPPRS